MKRTTVPANEAAVGEELPVPTSATMIIPLSVTTHVSTSSYLGAIAHVSPDSSARPDMPLGDLENMALQASGKMTAANSDMGAAGLKSSRACVTPIVAVNTVVNIPAGLLASRM